MKLFYRLSSKWIQTLMSLAVLVALWSIFVWVFQIPEYLIPKPSIVFRDLYQSRLYYLQHLKATSIEAFTGFAIAMVIAWFAGILFNRFKLIKGTVLPVVTALQAVPIVAIAPLFVVWLGSGFWSKTMMATTIAFFPTLTAILAAFSEADEQAVSLFRIYDASYIKTLRLLLIPASLPAITAGMQVSGGLATVGAIVAEMTGSDSGLGYVILNSSYRLQTAKLFVGIILSGVLGIAAYTIPGALKFLLPEAWADLRVEGSNR